VQRVHDLLNATGSGIDRRGALKLFAGIGVAGALSSTLAACTSAAPVARSDQTLRIGLILPQSGPLQEAGFEMNNGFNLYLALNNNLIAGMNTHVTAIDEGATTASGIAAVRAALKSNAYDVLVGVANSQVMAAIPDDVTAARIPLLGSNGSPGNMRSSPFVWRTSFVAGEASTALAAYLVGIPQGPGQSGELKRPQLIAIYNDGSPDALVEAQAFTAGLGGVYQTISIPVSASAPVASGVFSGIASSQADLVYAATSLANSGAFLTEYHRQKFTMPLCGPGVLTEQAAQLPAALHVYTSMNYAPDLNNDANATFTSAYFSQNQRKIPTAYAMTTYDAAAVLDVTISSMTGDVTALTINNELNNTQSIDSPRGRWQFNQRRTPLQQWYLRQVRADGAVLDNRVLAGLEALT
jgi:branched-chain amino acid transport system substrate-binding protein